MADIGRVRIRVPSSIKPGEIIKVRVLVMHPMEIVERKDGKPVDKNYHFINRVVVTYGGREIAQFETSQSVSENPFFSFAVRATEPGPLNPFRRGEHRELASRHEAHLAVGRPRLLALKVDEALARLRFELVGLLLGHRGRGQAGRRTGRAVTGGASHGEGGDAREHAATVQPPLAHQWSSDEEAR